MDSTLTAPTPQVPIESSAGWPWMVFPSTVECVECHGYGEVGTYTYMAPAHLGPHDAYPCEACVDGRIEITRCLRCRLVDEDEAPRDLDPIRVCTCGEDALTDWHEAGCPVDLTAVDRITSHAMRSTSCYKLGTSGWIMASPALGEIAKRIRVEAREFAAAGEHVLADRLDAIVASMELS